jgi:flagellar biogenesis protein FliO
MELYSQLLAILFTFALLGAAVWLLKKGGRLPWTGARSETGRELAVKEKVQLSPAHCLHLVEVRGRALIVATHPGGASFHPLGETFGAALRESLDQPGGGGK